MQKLYSRFTLLAGLLLAVFVPVLHAQTCTITSPTASQVVLAAAPVQLTATVSSAPSAYSLEYDIDYRRWRKAYATDQHPTIGDFGDNYQGPWVATWYSGLYGDGPHVISGILRDVYGTTLATCPTVNFTVRVEGMSSQTINLLPNLLPTPTCTPSNAACGTGAMGILTFDGINRESGPYIDGMYLPQVCGAVGATSQNPQVPGTGGGQVTAFNTTCFRNGSRLISYGYDRTQITDPYVIPATISSVSGTSIAFASCGTGVCGHFSVQTTVTNPDVVTFATTGSQYTGVNNGSQWYWAAGSGGGVAGTVTQTVSGSTIVLTTSAAHGATTGTPILVRNLDYTDQGGAGEVCDGLYAAASGTSGTTINLAMSSNPTCPNGTVTAATTTNPAALTFSGVIPSVGNLINLSGMTGTGWSGLGGTVCLQYQTGPATFVINAYDKCNYGNLIDARAFGTFGGGAFAANFPATGPGTANLEVDVNPYFANYVDGQHITVSASPNGSAPISLSGSCSGTCTVNQRIRSPYWGGNVNSSTSIMTDYAVNGGPALVTERVTFANPAATPMEIRPPYWEYHGWPGKTGDTLAAIIENTDLSSTACGASCSYFLTPDGTVTGAMSINAVTGAITYGPTGGWSDPSAATAWAQATVVCPTCIPSQSVSTTGSASSGAMSLTVPSAGLNINKGEVVTGTGLAPGTFVISVTSSTTVNLSQPTIGTLSSTAIVFSVPITAYVEQDPGTSSVFPHWTTCGSIVTTFVGGAPGSCHSFYPLSLQDANINPAVGPVPAWLGAGVFENGHFNSTMVNLTSGSAGQALMNPTSTSCPKWATEPSIVYWENYATTYGITLEFDLQPIWFNFSNGFANGGGLPVILANTGYNRQACLTALITHLVSFGWYWRFYNDDEATFTQGEVLRMPPTIQASVNSTWGSGWTQAVVSGTGITFTVVNPQSIPGNWNQSNGTGAWIQVVNAMNTCLNGWYPVLSQSGGWTSNNINGCGNGTYEPSGGITETTAQIVLNPSQLACINGLNGCNGTNNQQNISALPNNLTASQQGFTEVYTSSAIPGIVVASSSALVSVDCTASPTCTVNWTNHGIPNVAGQGIRIWNSAHGLNGMFTITNWATNSFKITYTGLTGQTAPTAAVYTSSNDSGLIITVDPNWGPDPLGQFYSIISAVSGHPTKSFSVQGGAYADLPAVYSYEGNKNNTDSSFAYFGATPFSYLGDSAGVTSWIYGDTGANGAGLATRAYQLKPRSALWGWGVANGGASLQTTCRSFTFNPGCDRPSQGINWRPEDIIAQLMGYKTHDYAALRNYNLYSDTINGYLAFCCGWQSTGGTGAGDGNSPYVAPKAFKAAALANALLTLRTETELQPEANKPFFGPYFTTDAHLSATYGNELQIVCGSESPYGSFPVTLPQISGGSMLKYVLTGYSLSMSVLGGNPTTDTDEFCATPGRTTTYVALPASPALNPVDHITFAAPSAFPSGTSKFLIQVGYYAPDLNDDPVTDCTSGCTIAVDHHDMDAYYRTAYADSNSVPKRTGSAIKIQSQGLF